MSWTTPRDLRAQVLRLWERGELLRELLAVDTRFPIRLVLKRPGSAELTSQFEAVRLWAQALAATPHIRLEWKAMQHRVQGTQSLPDQVWLNTPNDALTLIGKSAPAARFATLVEMTKAELPVLLPWLARRPLQALDLADCWPQLLAVVQWLRANPRPGVYLRQVDVPGVHSKFIETHRGTLAELFDRALPDDAIAPHATGLGQFATRYGFRERPLRVRLRVLDADMPLITGVTRPDLTLDADSFAALAPACRHVFITENETNFLAFPLLADSIVVFGSGYGWDALSQARWLENRSVFYWGDIDTHGFAILDALRARLPEVRSFLMDEATLHAHAMFWGTESAPIRHDLFKLTDAERRVYDQLRDDRLRPGLRLEQEHIAFGWVSDALAELANA